MREITDAWPLAQAGLPSRALTCLNRAGIATVGDLRRWNDHQLLDLPAFGPLSLRDVHWFLNWTRRLESRGPWLPDLSSLLGEFLTARQLPVIEQRFGLTDPLFRPWMKRETLREIGGERRGGITRERVRQVEAESLAQLRSHLAQTVAEPLRPKIARAKRHDPVLGIYEPWGAVFLMDHLYPSTGTA